MNSVIADQLERLNNWLTRRMGLMELDQPVVLKDGTMWLRIEPGEPPRWFWTDGEALGFRGKKPNGA